MIEGSNFKLLYTHMHVIIPTSLKMNKRIATCVLPTSRRENHRTRTAQLSRGGCSRRVNKNSVPSC